MDRLESHGLSVLCISASNNFRPGTKETYSYRLCKTVLSEAEKHIADLRSEIIELKNLTLCPCRDCMGCLDSRRCVADDTFNRLYDKIVACDMLFIVSPHYAPIPSKLCMLLEKMEQISFYRWEKDHEYRSEVYGIRTAVIAHGGGSGNEMAQGSGPSQLDYKRVVNDPIANALHTIQLELVPYDREWNTGIVVGPIEAEGVFSDKVRRYVRKVLNVQAG